MKVGSAVTVVDAAKARVYFKNFGEFFVNQIENAGTVLLTRTDKVSQEKIDEAVALIREHNQKATIITTPLAELDGKKVLETIEGGEDLQSEILAEVMAAEEEHHHHHHHHHDEHAEKFTDEDGNTVYRAHHHHDHDEDHEEEEHEHHCCHDHEHEEHEHHCCHDHEHEEHEHHCCHDHEHDADEVFESWGMETPQKYSAEEVERMLEALEDADTYGFVLRSKGMLPSADGTWVHFDYVPGEPQVRTGAADVTGKICVIGSGLHQDNLEKLFKRRNGNGQ